MKSRLTVAGVPVDPVTMDEAAAHAAGFLEGGGQHLIVTPNPEMAVLAERDPGFRKILASSDLALADGFGLRVAGWIEGRRIPATITGTDFALRLMELAEQKGYSVYLIGAGEGIAAKAAEKLKKKFPRLRIAGAESGGKIRWIAGQWEETPVLTTRIDASRPDILLVALGHGKQERWIRDHLPGLPSVRIAMGIGGALDYYAESVRRAPGLVRRLHLEWLWRLFAQPWRAWRIFEATALFMRMVLKDRLGKSKIGR